jgi:hypothetical protein
VFPVTLTLRPDGSLSLTQVGGGGHSTSPAGVVTFNQRNYIEVYCPDMSLTNSTWTIYVGNVLVATGALALSTMDNPVTNISLGSSLRGGSFTAPCIFDSIYLCDHTGSINNAPLGPQVVGVIVPAAPGNKTQWAHTGAGTDWEAVNNIPPTGDVAYISDSTVGEECAIELTTPSIFASVAAVSVVSDSREDTAAGRTIAAGVGNGATQIYGGNIALATTYAMNTTPFNSNPFTSSAWTLSDITTLQAAVKVTT